jgi:hypothetical protein
MNGEPPAPVTSCPTCPCDARHGECRYSPRRGYIAPTEKRQIKKHGLPFEVGLTGAARAVPAAQGGTA